MQTDFPERQRIQIIPGAGGKPTRELHARSAILDGEIVSLDRHGKTQLRDLLFWRGEPRFYAFDLLWIDGEYLRPAAD
jgi:ATP-dependent DNA ligase